MLPAPPIEPGGGENGSGRRPRVGPGLDPLWRFFKAVRAREHRTRSTGARPKFIFLFLLLKCAAGCAAARVALCVVSMPQTPCRRAFRCVVGCVVGRAVGCVVLAPADITNEPAAHRATGRASRAGCRRRRAAHRATGRAGWRVGALGRWRRRRRRAAGRPMSAGQAAQGAPASGH